MIRRPLDAFSSGRLHPECAESATPFFDAVYKRGTQGEKRQAKSVQYENSDSAANRSKIRELKILAYKKVREFSTSRNFTIRRPLDEFSLGRSMVEMLGVLAIIGVLSVGGIAGYTKAREMYRINQIKENVSLMMSAMLYLRPQIDFKKSAGDLLPVMDAFDLLPPGTKRYYNLLKDNFGNTFLLQQQINGYKVMLYQVGPSQIARDSCIATLSAAFEYPKEIILIHTPNQAMYKKDIRAIHKNCQSCLSKKCSVDIRLKTY